MFRPNGRLRKELDAALHDVQRQIIALTPSSGSNDGAPDNRLALQRLRTKYDELRRELDRLGDAPAARRVPPRF